jgi:hypothetical protein
MITYDLRTQHLTIDELFRHAADEAVHVITQDGQTFIVEPADDFAREVALLRQSKKFMAFLAERAKEPASITLDELDREIDETLAREAATTSDEHS